MFEGLRHRDVQVVVGLLSGQILHKRHEREQNPLVFVGFLIFKQRPQKRFTYDHVKLGINIHNFACKEIQVSSKAPFIQAPSGTERRVPTGVVHHRQGRHPPLHKDVERFDDGRVGVNESNVPVCTNAQLPQGLLHESGLWHLTHLETRQTRKVRQGCVHGRKQEGLGFGH